MILPGKKEMHFLPTSHYIAIIKNSEDPAEKTARVPQKSRENTQVARSELPTDTSRHSGRSPGGVREKERLQHAGYCARLRNIAQPCTIKAHHMIKKFVVKLGSLGSGLLFSKITNLIFFTC